MKFDSTKKFNAAKSIQDRDMSAYIHDLWNRIGEKLRKRKIGISEIKGAIQEVRASKQ